MPQCPECHAELAGGETFCPQCRARLDEAAPDTGASHAVGDQARARPPFQQVDIPPLQEFDMEDDLAYFTPPDGVKVVPPATPRKPLFQDMDALDTLVSEPPANRAGWRSRWQEASLGKGMASHIKVTVPRRLWRLRWLYLLAALSTFLAMGVGLGSLYWKPDEDEITVDNYALGLAYYEQGRFEVAQHLFGEAVNEEMGLPVPDMGPALTMMGWSAYRQGYLPEASAYFGAALAMDAEAADPQVGMGLAALGEGSLDEAETWLLGARDVAPDSPAAQRALGQLYLELNQLDLALDALQRAVELAPADREALRWLGVAQYRSGNLEPAIRSLELAAIDDGDRDAMQILVDAYAAVGQHEAAIAAAERLRSIDPGNPEIEYLYGLTLLRANRLAEAQAALEGATAGPAGDVLSDAYRTLGIVASNQERYEDALDVLERALAIRPDDAHALELKGWAMARRGLCAEALSVFERALEIDASRQGAAEGLAACRSWLGQ
jgi:tetratricopeptide (TPR) repeat protein